VIILAALINENVRRVTKVASIGLCSIAIVPLIDWFSGRGYMITYPLRLEPYLMNFLNPFVSLVEIGVSPGQRIVVFIISLLVAVYGYSKTKSRFRAFGLFLVSLIVIIIFGGLTTLLAANKPEIVYVAGGILYTDTQKYCAIYLLMCSILAFIFLFMLDKESMSTIVSTLRWERIFFYGGLAIFGYGISMVYKRAEFHVSIFNYLGVVIMCASLMFGYWGLQVFNDVFDTEIDRVVGKKNPLLNGVDKTAYRRFGMFLMIASLCYAVVINFTAFLILHTYLLLGILYSLPPIRLKRVPVLSTALLACAVVLAIATGFSVHYGGRALNAMPRSILFPTLIAVTLGFVAKDIGHVAGDKVHGAMTLPVLFNSQNNRFGRVAIAILISTSYLVYAFFIPQVLTIAALFALATLMYTLFVKHGSEVFYFIMLYMFGGYLFYILIRLLPS
jgi:homogentisate phytyltransferase/homogentisate geranylgeranyltransferase